MKLVQNGVKRGKEMKLKQIKDGTLIHCKTVSEVAKLVEHTGASTDYILPALKGDDLCFLIENGTIRKWVHTEYSKGNLIVEFSDLFLPEVPELTVDEVLQIPAEICKNFSDMDNGCYVCPFSNFFNCDFRDLERSEEIKEICMKWKEECKKKELKLEKTLEYVCDHLYKYANEKEQTEQWLQGKCENCQLEQMLVKG